jgi:hypothetical protein
MWMRPRPRFFIVIVIGRKIIYLIRYLLGLALKAKTEVYIDEKVIREMTTGLITLYRPAFIRAPLNPRAPHISPPGQPL